MLFGPEKIDYISGPNGLKFYGMAPRYGDYFFISSRAKIQFTIFNKLQPTKPTPTNYHLPTSAEWSHQARVMARGRGG